MIRAATKQKKYNLTDPPGVICPSCKGIIKFTIEQLVSARPVYCSNCGLKLTMDVAQSQESLFELATLNDAMKKIDI
jgi:transcription elongation factor Elf1